MVHCFAANQEQRTRNREANTKTARPKNGANAVSKIKNESLSVCRLWPLPFGALAAVAFLELLDPASGVDEALLASEEWVASGADADAHVLDRAAGVIRRATGANDGSVLVFWMNFRSHAGNGLDLPRLEGREE